MSASACGHTSSPACGVLTALGVHRVDQTDSSVSLPDDIGGGASFRMLICHLCIFFSEVSLRSSACFLLNTVLPWKNIFRETNHELLEQRGEVAMTVHGTPSMVS